MSLTRHRRSILQRDLEREVIPLCRSEGMAIAPWNVLAAGKIRSNEEEKRRMESGEKGRALFTADWLRTPEQKKVCDVLEEIAKEVGGKTVTAGK